MSRSPTSVAAYQRIRAEGLLSKMRMEVYTALYALGPSTAAEIARRMTETGTPRGGGRAGPGNVSARLIELEQLNVVTRIGERECAVTANHAIVWEMTDQLPSGKVTYRSKSLPRDTAEAVLRDLPTVYALHQLHQTPFPESLRELWEWLYGKYGTK